MGKGNYDMKINLSKFQVDAVKPYLAKALMLFLRMREMASSPLAGIVMTGEFKRSFWRSSRSGPLIPLAGEVGQERMFGLGVSSPNGQKSRHSAGNV